MLQTLALAAVASFVWWVASNANEALSDRGIASGFDFLETEAKFGIIQHLIPYTEQSSYGRALLVGLLNTLLVAALGIVFATILGFVAGIAQLSSNWLVSRLAKTYVEIVRNVPLLLQLFFWYAAVLRSLPAARDSFELGGAVFLNNRGLYVPHLVLGEGAAAVLWAIVLGIVIAWLTGRESKRRRILTGRGLPTLWIALASVAGFPLVVALTTGAQMTLELPVLQGFNFKGGVTILPELMALTLALSIYTASYIAEIVRSGIEGVQRGQIEASSALGLSRGQRLRLVIIPQAMRIIVPPLTSQYLNLTKNSSLAIAIAYPDIVNVFAGTTLGQTGQAIEVLAITMAIYLALSLVTSAVMNVYNARVRLTER